MVDRPFKYRRYASGLTPRISRTRRDAPAVSPVRLSNGSTAIDVMRPAVDAPCTRLHGPRWYSRIPTTAAAITALPPTHAARARAGDDGGAVGDAATAIGVGAAAVAPFAI